MSMSNYKLNNIETSIEISKFLANQGIYISERSDSCAVCSVLCIFAGSYVSLCKNVSTV